MWYLHLADAVVCDQLKARLAEQAGCCLIEHDLLAWFAAAPGRRLRMLDLATRLRVIQGRLTRIHLDEQDLPQRCASHGSNTAGHTGRVEWPWRCADDDATNSGRREDHDGR